MNIEAVYLNSRIVSQVRGNAVLNGSVPKRTSAECVDEAGHGHNHGGGMRLRSLKEDHSDRSDCTDDRTSSFQQIR